MKKTIKLSSFILLFAIFTITSCSGTEESNSEVLLDSKTRDQYIENGEVLFTIFPDPGLVAGKSFGYVISFSESFETYKGKELSIYAYHEETGKQIIAFPPEIITEPSSGYLSLNRFTFSFELPLSGLWRYEIILDKEVYGDVILDVKE
ncbi:hypothetical protein [Chengkuizengella axinellae]|uniref:DUF4871 domain-containing protein n=1 Tax=Chengkuizengella axinellae TaxID=3064388 RepID=A0ABT9IV78_9BACL|nr:hypothetical protein [Chengkuizengella sp. 2205SS18-9]MDP5273256.1 hypothetical protein [Chengkuizengella sp. 2205SS18-9]